MRPWPALALLPLFTAQAPAPTHGAGALQEPAPLVHDWIPALGEVQVDALGGTRLRLAVRGEEPRTVELEGFAPGTRIRAAAASAFVGTDVALALAVEDGQRTSYHFLVHQSPEPSPAQVRVAPGAHSGGWTLSRALFESAGEPYRIVDLHCPGTDALEITFRRGFPNVSGLPRPIDVDEKLYFDSCPGALAAGVLLDVGELQPVR